MPRILRGTLLVVLIAAVCGSVLSYSHEPLTHTTTRHSTLSKRDPSTVHYPRLTGPEGDWKPDDLGQSWPWKEDKVPKDFPKIQANQPQETTEEKEVRLYRQQRVKDAFLYSWNNFKKLAIDRRVDSIGPLTGENQFEYGWGALAVDSMDTMLIMNLTKQWQSVARLLPELAFRLLAEHRNMLDLHEATARFMGAMIAMADLTGDKDKIFSYKAKELAFMVTKAFDTKNGLPLIRVQWEKHLTETIKRRGPERLTLNELGGFGLEFTKMTQFTRNMWFWTWVKKSYKFVEARNGIETPMPGMYPNDFKAEFTPDKENRFRWDGTTYSMDKDANEFYANIPKLHVLLGGANPDTAAQWGRIGVMSSRTKGGPAFPVKKNPLRKLGTFMTNTGVVEQKGCSAGATMALAGKVFDQNYHARHAPQLTAGSLYAASQMGTGILPERSHWEFCGRFNASQDGPECGWEQFGNKKQWGSPTSVEDPSYCLGGELFESAFYMYRITGDKHWQEEAWKLFEKSSSTPRRSMGCESRVGER
ncbi:glycoside hydrolase [Podospora australis]|uniref:alpha-1,2-Mannosidase n=1 Tax=Podospora australis TaxID=1536484 RepID=A0AAN7AMZ5_9PEZI|nr:glycoside hydrolase [Podospora australis]